MPDFAVQRLLETPAVTVRDVHCAGRCRHRSAEECATGTQLVFPYRGLYLHHVGRSQSVADANQVLFFNAGAGYQVSHPVAGGDASLVLALDAALLQELAPRALLQARAEPALRVHSQRIDPQAQATVALLRHGLRSGSLEPLQAEGLAMSLARRAMDRERSTHTARSTPARRRLVERVKRLLSEDPGRRWTHGAIAAEIGGSAAGLAEAFRQVEGMPLYRYQLRLRLARALDLVVQAPDMSALALDLGFSSHSHFTAAFRRTYGRTPTGFRRATQVASACTRGSKPR